MGFTVAQTRDTGVKQRPHASGQWSFVWATVTGPTGNRAGLGFRLGWAGKTKGKEDNFRKTSGLVQPRIEMTLRCAPVISILWGLGMRSISSPLFEMSLLGFADNLF